MHQLNSKSLILTAATGSLILLVASAHAQQQSNAASSSGAPAPASSQAVSPPDLNVVPVAPERVLATPRDVARDEARIGAGRSNPFSAVISPKPFPSNKPVVIKKETVTLPKTGSYHFAVAPPPPPPNMPVVRGPGEASAAPEAEDSLPSSELPAPPDKPSLANQLRLAGIVGNRAMFTFTDPSLRAAHQWPKVLTLGAGDQFESISVLNVAPDSVLIEEDGERHTKQLQRIR